MAFSFLFCSPHEDNWVFTGCGNKGVIKLPQNFWEVYENKDRPLSAEEKRGSIFIMKDYKERHKAYAASIKMNKK